MKHFRLTLPRGVGSPLTHAVKLVRLASRFHSTVLLKCNGEIADLRRHSIITIVALCAMAKVLEIEAAGADERAVVQTIAQSFPG
jgi:phosphotransferase system HPr (HPr) family protein